MNLTERKMVDVLTDLRENHCVVGVKAEFEAEGTRLEEALRLKEVVMKAGLGLTMKVGGCEALRDMYEARVIGVSKVVAPMIETPYALKKFVCAVHKVFPKEEWDDIKFAINVESVEASRNFDDMLALPEMQSLSGIVVGRSDMTGSLGMSRDAVNSERIFDVTKELAKKAKSKGLEVTIGGGVSAQSLPFFKALSLDCLDYYETRKVVFSCPDALAHEAENAILKAVGFELLWLKNKRDFYQMISLEDEIRIQYLEGLYKVGIENQGLSV